MSRPLGVGIIGAGIVFEQHARALEHLADRARLLAVADVDPLSLRRATSLHFIPFAHGDYRSLLDRPDVDLVSVCTPPCTHEEIVIAALEAGKLVVCEKPLAPALASADRILEAAARHPGRLSTVHQFRYLVEVRRAAWLRDQGRLGPLLFGQFSRYARYQEPSKKRKPGRDREPPKPRADWWGRWSIAGGGVVMTQLIHELDLMRHLFGPATQVSAAIDTLKEPIESEDTCAATVRFENGALACCYGTVCAPRSWHCFDVIGTLASVHLPWSLESTDSRFRKQATRDVLLAHPQDGGEPCGASRLGAAVQRLAGLTRRAGRPKPAPSTHTSYYAAVLDAVEEGRPLPIGPEEARASLELGTALYASALSGGPVTLPLHEGAPFYGGVSSRDYEARRAERVRAIPRASTVSPAVER